MSSTPSEAEVYALARKQLGLPAQGADSSVPASYVRELRRHIDFQPDDTNFSVKFQPGTGFGLVTCLEGGCDNAKVKLNANLRSQDGGKKLGFGGLSAYRTHIATNRAHNASRLDRLRASLAAKSGSPPAGTSNPSTRTKRLSLQGIIDRPVTPGRICAVSASGSENTTPFRGSKLNVTRKRLSEGGPHGREGVDDVKRVLTTTSHSSPIKGSASTNAGDLCTPKRLKLDDTPLGPHDSNKPDRTSALPWKLSTPANSQSSAASENTPVVEKAIKRDTAHSFAPQNNASQAKGSGNNGASYPFEPSLTALNSWKDNRLTEGLAENHELDLRTSRSPGLGPVASSSRVAVDLLQEHMQIDPLYSIIEHVSGFCDDKWNPYEDPKDPRFHYPHDYYGRAGARITGPVAKPEDLQNFFLLAGNAEQFDGNASVGDALNKLGLSDLDSHFCGIKYKLMPHQVIGVAWMLEKEKGYLKGGILADEMGLGKTVQMIATMMGNRSDDPDRKTTLIVAPVALLTQWETEINVITRGALSCLIYHGSSKRSQKKKLHTYDVVLTTSSTLALEWPDPIAEERKEERRLRKMKQGGFIVDDSEDDKKKRNKKQEEEGPLFNVDFYRVVIDEAQTIKNRNTRISRAVMKLSAKLRWCLTGTPITNGLADAYPLLCFLEVRPWYDWTEFYDHIMKYEKKSPQVSTEKLQAIFAQVLLRRKKDAKLDGKRLIELPPKNVELHSLEFTPEERDVYKMVETRSQQIFNNYLRAGTVLKNYAHVFVLLLRLRQICSHASLITEEENLVIDDELEAIMINSQETLARATDKLGKEFVVKLKEKLRMSALSRMAAEKESVDTMIETEECPICHGELSGTVVTPCMHFFCGECLDELFSSQPIGADERHGEHERSCPMCRAAVRRDCVFPRLAFEPTDNELYPTVKVEDKEPTTAEDPSSMTDRDDDLEMPDISEVLKKDKAERILSTKGKGKAKASAKVTATRSSKRAKARRVVISDNDMSEEEDMDDDLSDFIVQSDEDEEEKDRRKKHKKRLCKHKSDMDGADYEDSDFDVDYDNDFDDVIIGTGQSIDYTKIDGLSKALPSTKMIHMMDKVQAWQQDHPDEKTLVISQWTKCLDLVSNYLESKSIGHVRYQGDMNRARRERAVQAFMDEKNRPRIMLLSLKCGGVGLNLTRANRVISLDLGWSDAVESQAFDRVHRLGQERPVFVHRLVIRDTVEDRVLALQEKKKILADGSLGEGNGKKIGRLSVRELANLFGLDHRGQVLQKVSSG